MNSAVPYPKPSIPVLPIFSPRVFYGKKKQHYPCIADIDNIVEVTRGSVAIALALKHAKIKNGDKVLVSAFNCRSMVEPILFNSAIPITYRIKRNLSIDLEDIEEKLDKHTKVLIVTHYFGFPQEIQTIRSFCDQNSLVLIEDCAHAFFGSSNGKPIGWIGDYAIASLRKFFPVFDGGYLVSSRRSIDNSLVTNGGYKYNLKAATNIIEEAGQYQRMKGLNQLLKLPMYFKELIPGRSKKSENHAFNNINQAQFSDKYVHLDIEYFGRRMSYPSRFIVKTVATNTIVEKRRENYKRILKELSGLSKCRALFNQLPEHVVPYMFPLLIDKPEIFFPRLKHKGIPIWRWDDMSRWHENDDKKTCCEISDNYSYQLLQLPCHQELSDLEIDLMVKTIREVFHKG